MAFVLTAVGVFGVAAGLFASSFGLVIAARGGRHLQARSLALVLFLEGGVALWGTGIIYLTDDPASVLAAQLTGTAALVCLAPAQLLFLSTLEGRPAAALRSRPIRVSLVVLMALAVAAVLIAPGIFSPGVHAGRYSPFDAFLGPGFYVGFLSASAVSMYALVVTFAAYRMARSAGSRERARAFLAAYLTRDLLFLGFTAILLSGRLPAAGTVSPGVLIFAYVPILVYGVLKSQLFDVDLRIKRSISRGTVVAAFAGVFFVVGVVAENYLSARFGYLIGGAAAGFLLLALGPLQRIGHRIADAAMPTVEDTPAYAAFRKLEVYKAALEGALTDGHVTPKERDMLARLRQSLGIAEVDATALERDLAQSGPT